jgi:hypothetical protein
VKAALALIAACLLVLVCAATASASKESYVGTPSELLGAGPCSDLTVSGLSGNLHTTSAVEMLTGDEGSSEDDYEFLDDGTITSWGVGGYEEANASVKLDVIEKSFRDGVSVISESPRAEKIYENTFDTERSNAWTHVVEAGQAIGVTVRAGEAPENKHDTAAVNCEPGARGADAFNVWQPSLIEAHVVAPTEEGVHGDIGIFALVEYDTPIIASISSNKGSALGGQEITVEGEHLANARRPEYGKENLGTIVENTNTLLKFKTPEANESEGAVEGSVKPKIATFGGEATLPVADQTYTYAETDKVPSREPAVTPIEVSKLSSTSATLSTTVNVKDLQIGVCAFEVEPVGGFSEDEEEAEEENEEVCEPLPKPFSYAAQPVSVTFANLKPGTTYYYNLFLTTKWDGRSGRYQSPFKTLSFKTSGGSGEPKKEPTKELAKELSSGLPAPITTPVTKPLPGPLPVPAAALAGAGSVTASETGTFSIKISCPVGISSCIGSIIVKTASSVTTSSAHASKKVVLTLAKGTFTVAGGKTATVKLHLSVAARKLLRKVHALRARATIAAHDAEGTSHTNVSAITIHAPKRHAH